MSITSHPVTSADVARSRAFSRFYTNHVGALRTGLLDSPWSLTEVRVMYELAQAEGADPVEVADLRRELDIDGGQLSRLLSRLAADGLITRHPSPNDGRRQSVALTTAGSRAAALMDDRANGQMQSWLARLPPDDQRRLVDAMGTVRELFAVRSANGRVGPGPERSGPTIRELQPGDLGWIVERHGVLYAAEYDWDRTFEALVASVVAEYGRSADPERSGGWIAELDSERVGCVLCVGTDDTTAQLRLLLVEPGARGHGIGGRLVRTCLEFARRAGYQRMNLWTNDCLHAARHIYQREGFELVASEPHHSFGHDLVGQTWERAL